MNQTATTPTDTHPVSDLMVFHLQLDDDGKFYCRNLTSKEGHEKLLHTLQTNDCREIISAVVDRDDLAHSFVVAGHKGHVDILEAFMNHGMKIDITNASRWTALMEASYSECEECVRFLLDHNAAVDFQNDDGETAMMIASHYGFINIVGMLLEKNANPDIQENRGMTALMVATASGYKKVVQILLNHGADIELKNEEGDTALDVAENEEIKEMLLNHVNTSYVLK